VIDRGGENSADTYFDRTQYYNVVARDDFPLALDGLADIMQHALIDKDGVEHERRVVSEELRIGLDNPSTQAINGLMHLAFPDHPYGRPVIGTLASVAGLDAQGLHRFYKTFYAPNDMVLVIAGDVQPDSALALVRQDFGNSLPNPNLPAGPGPTGAWHGLREQRDMGDVRQATLDMGFPVPGYQHPDRPTLELLARILSERLVQAEEGRAQLASSISCSYLPLRVEGILSIYAQPAEITKYYALKRGVLQELVRLRATGVSEDELREARRKLRLEYLFDQENILEQAQQLGEAALYGGVRYGLEYLQDTQHVTKAQVDQAIHEYLVRDNVAIYELMPKNMARAAPFDQAEIDRLLPVLALGGHDPVDFRQVRYPGAEADAITSTTAPQATPLAQAAPAGERWQLHNGLTAVLRQEPRLPLVSVVIAVQAGSGFSTQPGLAALTAQGLYYGGWRYSFQQLRSLIDRWGGHFQLSAGQDSAHLNLTVARDDLDQALAVASDILIHPTFYDSEMAAAQRGQQAWLEGELDDASGVAFKTWRQHLYGAAHPYGQPIYGTREGVKNLSRDDMVQFHRACYRPERTVVALVGDLAPAEAHRLLDRYFGDWQPPPAPGPVEPGRTIRESGDFRVTMAKQQAYMVMGVPAVALSHPDYWPLALLSDLLGLRNFTDLVYNKSMAYQSYSTLDAFRAGGGLNLFLSTKASDWERGRQELVAKLRQVREEPVSPAELANTQQRLIGGRALSEQRTGNLAWSLAEWQQIGGDYRLYDELPQRIRQVSAADLQRIARRYIDLDHLVTVIVGPE